MRHLKKRRKVKEKKTLVFPQNENISNKIHYKRKDLQHPSPSTKREYNIRVN